MGNRKGGAKSQGDLVGAGRPPRLGAVSAVVRGASLTQRTRASACG